ncbi:MAG: hypothetical protein JSV09_09875 [Thermoplasmata archaeon]|nr:MAG: hypothetical protein JSV09_09875 [Thermoplasmata archaeon]
MLKTRFYEIKKLFRFRGITKKTIIGISVLFLISSIPAGQFVDMTPPQLEDFSFNPASIDVSEGAVDITITITATDDMSGVSYISVNFWSPSHIHRTWTSYFTLINGNNRSGTWEGKVTIPRYCEAGTWKVRSLYIYDLVGNGGCYADHLEEAGFPVDLIVASDPSDTVPPTVHGLIITPSSVNVSSSPQTVTVELHLEDDVSGIPAFGGTSLRFESPSGNQVADIPSWAYNPDLPFRLISGNVNDGIWLGIVEIPQYSENGTWKIKYVEAEDAVNEERLNTSDLEARGFPVELNVTSNPSDTSPPELNFLNFEPKMINTSTGHQEVLVRFGIVDYPSGVNFSMWPGYNYIGLVGFRSPSGMQRNQAAWTDINLISGTPQEGWWEAMVYFPQFSEDGTWEINFILLADKTRNELRLDTAALEAMGMPTELVVIKPNVDIDGTLLPNTPSEVHDDVYYDAWLSAYDPEVLGGVATDVTIHVFDEPLEILPPSGFQAAGTPFVYINLDPKPSFPLPYPGIYISLPLTEPIPTGGVIELHRVDPETGELVPVEQYRNIDGQWVLFPNAYSHPKAIGANYIYFGNLASCSTIVGLIPEASPVSINIKPGSYPNSVNPGSKGVIPVAILTTSTSQGDPFDFDATCVDPSTVRFGPNQATIAHEKGHIEDVDGDGDFDLLLHFIIQNTGLNSGDTQATLTGETYSGEAIKGVDTVRIVQE